MQRYALPAEELFPDAWDFFHKSWNLCIFVQMEEFDKILFLPSLKDFWTCGHPDYVVHILCMKGALGLSYQDVRFNVGPEDFVILTNMGLVGDVSQSDDFEGYVMALSYSYANSRGIQSSYGIVGFLYLMQNPVFHLEGKDYVRCEAMLRYIKRRLDEGDHLFMEDFIGHILAAHILDIYDVHAKRHHDTRLSSRSLEIMQNFLRLLFEGAYREHREVGWYAGQLHITPHHLTDICREASSQPATYWINRFCVQEISLLLQQGEHSLTEIADRFNFSSQSWFTRYVVKETGLTPAQFRKGSRARR